MVTSTIATGVIFTWLMDPDYGLINAGLHEVGLPTFQFFASPGQALPAVVIMTVWGWVGFGALIFLAGLQGIPQDLLDAAQIDGCCGGGAFWRIQVPLLRPVTGFLLVWLTINSLQLFDEVYATTKGGPAQATTVVVYYLYQQAFQFFHAGYAAAIATVLFVAIALITLVQLRLTRDRRRRGGHGMTTVEEPQRADPAVAAVAAGPRVASGPDPGRAADGVAVAVDARHQPVDAGRDPALPARAAVSLHWHNFVDGVDRLAVRRGG